eukprot:6203643-Pleurochrysis_carterae.AAC.4
MSVAPAATGAAQYHHPHSHAYMTARHRMQSPDHSVTPSPRHSFKFHRHITPHHSLSITPQLPATAPAPASAP